MDWMYADSAATCNQGPTGLIFLLVTKDPEAGKITFGCKILWVISTIPKCSPYSIYVLARLTNPSITDHLPFTFLLDFRHFSAYLMHYDKAV